MDTVKSENGTDLTWEVYWGVVHSEFREEELAFYKGCSICTGEVLRPVATGGRCHILAARDDIHAVTGLLGAGSGDAWLLTMTT